MGFSCAKRSANKGPSQRIRVSGSESAGPSRRIRVSGSESADPSRRMRVTGSESADPSRRIRVGGSESASPSRRIRVGGSESADPSRRVRVGGCESARDDPTRTPDLSAAANLTAAAHFKIYFKSVYNSFSIPFRKLFQNPFYGVLLQVWTADTGPETESARFRRRGPATLRCRRPNGRRFACHDRRPKSRRFRRRKPKSRQCRRLKTETAPLQQSRTQTAPFQVSKAFQDDPTSLALHPSGYIFYTLLI